MVAGDQYYVDGTTRLDALHRVNANREAATEHRSVQLRREARDGPAARRALGASVLHGSCAQRARSPIRHLD